MNDKFVELDKNARIILQELNASKFPLASSELAYNTNRLSISNTTISTILDYLQEIGYITMYPEENIDSNILLSYTAMFYEELLIERNKTALRNNVLLPLLISTISAVITIFLTSLLVSNQSKIQLSCPQVLPEVNTITEEQDK